MSDRNSTLAAIVVCGEPATFSTWLKSTFLELAKHKGVRIVLVPWSVHDKTIRLLAPQSIEICEPSQDTTLEANRNAALNYLQSDKPALVAFLDEDTFINPSWVDAMISAADTNQDIDAFASVVFTEGWNEMQGQGHVFVRGAPRDRGYRGKDLKRPILCPCGNSAVVRWKALQRIWEVDNQAWDPLFNQDQTCFDFGLKLVLTGARTMVVPGAVAQHRGYLFSKGAAWQRKHGCSKVEQQLTARYLLYKKFLTEELEKAALAALNSRLGDWQERGYPGFQECVKGNKVNRINEKAWKHANDLAIQITCTTWKYKMAEFEKARKLLDLTDEEAGPPNMALQRTRASRAA